MVGEGSLSAEMMFIGEAPGANEDRTGRPFCGAAGKVLDELLQSAAIKRESVFITSILKCRPPGNRPPRTSEIKACTSYLETQIELIKPKIISPLGNFATRFIFKKFGLENKLQRISKIHGKVFLPVVDAVGGLKIIPLYHPAVAVYNAKMLPILKKDFQVLTQ